MIPSVLFIVLWNEVRLIRLQVRGFTDAGGTGGGFSSNARSENAVRKIACPMISASCDEKRYFKAKWAAKTADTADRVSATKPTQMLYLLIVVGNGTIFQKMPRK